MAERAFSADVGHRGRFIALAVLFITSSCALTEAPWSRVKKGTNEVGLFTGWSAYGADVDAEGLDGPLAGANASANSTLEPRYGSAIIYNRFVRDDLSIGVYAGIRSFDPESVDLFGATFDGDSFETLHLALTTRHHLSPFGQSQRWRPVVGLDLTYVPEVDLKAKVTYAPGLSETIDFNGDAYFTINPLVGMSYLMRDDVAVQFGTFYEIPLGTSDGTVTLNTPFGPSNVDVKFEASGFIFYVLISYFQ